MSCTAIRARVSERLDGAVVEGLDDHLAGCPDCRRFSAGAESVRRGLRLEAVGEMPDVAAAVRRRLEAEAPLVAAADVAQQPAATTQESGGEAESATPGAPEPPFSAELGATDDLIRRRQARDREMLAELERTESSISSNRERTEQALDEARRRLEAIESQAGEAEQRAERAEQLAELKQQELDRERSLHEMLERINEAERRARESERRAREAVADVARPAAPLAAPKPLPPEPEPAPFEQVVAAQPTAPDAAAAAQLDPEPAPEVRVRESDQSVAPAGSDLAPEAGPPEPRGKVSRRRSPPPGIAGRSSRE